jgi:hypothetical protein
MFSQALQGNQKTQAFQTLRLFLDIMLIQILPRFNQNQNCTRAPLLRPIHSKPNVRGEQQAPESWDCKACVSTGQGTQVALSVSQTSNTRERQFRTTWS